MSGEIREQELHQSLKDKINEASSKALVAEQNAKDYTDDQLAPVATTASDAHTKVTAIEGTFYTIEQADQKFTAKHVGDTAPSTAELLPGDTWYNALSGVFSIWNGTAWGELSMNNPKGTVNFNTNNARLVIPVGIDKWAT
jgi:hypothetical protein